MSFLEKFDKRANQPGDNLVVGLTEQHQVGRGCRDPHVARVRRAAPAKLVPAR